MTENNYLGGAFEKHKENLVSSKISDDNDNVYVQTYAEEQKLSELEQGAPRLDNPTDRSLNKKAIGFLVAAGFLIAGLIAYIIYLFQPPEETAKEATPQVVSVPDLPPVPQNAAGTMPADSTNVPVNSAANPQAIEVVPAPAQASQPTQVVHSNNYSSEPMPVPSDPLVERRKMSSTMVETGASAGAQSATNTSSMGSVQYLKNRDKLLLKGTYLRCVLETKIVTDVPGFTSCVITEPVYSMNGRYVLIPKGSKAMGQYNTTNPNTPRLGVIWDRIITPTGFDIALRSPGVDNLGASGHYGNFQTHWVSRFGSALLISLISDVFKFAAAQYGPDGSTVSTSTSTTTNPYESETANTVKQMAINQIERNNSRPNTITINQGSLINIYTAQDVDFSAVIQ